MTTESSDPVLSKSDRPESEAAPLLVTLLCGDPADGRDFIRGVLDSNDESDEGTLFFQNRSVRLETLSANPETHAGWKNRVNQAQVLVLIVRHMDPVSLRAARIRFGRLSAIRSVPLGIFVLREPEEDEYKIGCPSCGQKLRMRESHVGRRGRCPNCRNALKIPDPIAYLRDRLLLPDAIPILHVPVGDPALCRGALANLLARTAICLAPPDRRQQQATLLKQATVPIYIESGGIRIGSDESGS